MQMNTTEKQIAVKTFVSPIVAQNCSDSENLGKFESTMTLYFSERESYGYIEWDIPYLNEFKVIGLWFENDELIDYDGVFSLPKQAIEMIKSSGFVVLNDFQ
jgi:hypothetical protein